MIKPRREAQRKEMIDNVHKEALANAITKVSALIQQEKLAAEQAKAIEEGSVLIMISLNHRIIIINRLVNQ